MTIHARPTTYNGIRMRSRLEASYAAELDRRRLPWEYEPRCFANAQGQYLPDFKVGGNTYIEIKPPNANHPMALQRMHIILSSEPTARLQVATRTLDTDRFDGVGTCSQCPICSTCACDRTRNDWCRWHLEELSRRRDAAVGDIFPPHPEPLMPNEFQCQRCHEPATTGFLYEDVHDDIRLCDAHTAEALAAGIPLKGPRRTSSHIREYGDAQDARELVAQRWTP